MGIVKKNAYKNTLITYTGMVIGYINLVLLYPIYLSTKEYGLFNLIGGIAILYSIIASLGIPNIIARYFAYHRTEDREHKGFMHWAAMVSLIGFIAATLLFIVFKPIIVASYIQKSPLFLKYYYYLIPLTFFTICFNFLEMTGRVIYQTVFSGLLKDVLLRLFTTAGILMLAVKWIDFQGFIILYVFINFLVSVMLLISIAASKKISIKLKRQSISKINSKELITYGLYTLISTTIYVLLQKVDIIMLSSMSGLSEQGVYSFFFNIAVVIGVPAQALSRTTYQIVTDSWKSKDMPTIAGLYYKTSIIQLVVGLLLFIGIIINRDNLTGILHKKEYSDHFNVFIIIGLGFLVDITGGLNTAIIAASHKYRLAMGFVITSGVVCVILNYLLIPKFGGAGAALAYLITMTAFNLGNWFYIKVRFKMQPFHYKHLLAVAIALVSFFVGKYFWRMPNLYLDIAVRSGVTTLIYILMTYYLHISDDVNEKVDSVLKRVATINKRN
ncbi:oligosaccharide flippase family protein [Mucilaginibacter sp. KACC 22773]|uniref:oligosaccharide flippase family protein n=1 Tax=Mucilaginibacter sp. KACC 22773 TaxID=3025671 RepID=UPI0023673738|nr:oligosaccharide flippase family protein [Mucilaginibacter sp. KACC 22773]WDF78772.1 oligosaccharide flippase family protein [Mucilaginibacter sp. KACC 22773]